MGSKMKFLLSASLVLFCSSAITTGSDCTESDSFVIKNAMQSTGAYLTLDVKTNTLKGGNLMRTGPSSPLVANSWSTTTTNSVWSDLLRDCLELSGTTGTTRENFSILIQGRLSV